MSNVRPDPRYALGLYVWGINAGGSATFLGMKFSLSTALLLDSNGTFSIVTSQEAGAGKGKSAGLFFNGVWGGKETHTCDYAGTGTSVSGSRGRWGVAVSLPDYGNGGSPKPFYEFGFSKSIGTSEAGVTRTFGQVGFTSNIFGNSGRWWGSHIYKWAH